MNRMGIWKELELVLGPKANDLHSQETWRRGAA